MTEGQEPEPQVTQEEETQPAAEGTAEAPALDALTALRDELEQAKAREAEYLDGWQRARAELANARKRFQREQEYSYSNAQADVLVRLLPIVDDLERAFDTLPYNLSGFTWIEGILLIQRKLQLLLEQAGVAPIEAVGKEFDPFAHQAITHEPSQDVAAGYVISELQKGYRAGERILRPALVRVSSGAPAAPEVEPEAPKEEAPGGEPEAEAGA